MTRHDLIIDGDNLREEYGVHLCKGSVANFISLPQFKDMDGDDWAEEDSVDVECSSPVFRRKEFELTIAGDEEGVLYWSSANTYSYLAVTIDNTPIVLQKCLTLGTTAYSSLNGLHMATVRFASDDDPYQLLDNHTAADFPQLPHDEGWWFVRSGTLQNFGDIGVRVLRGTEDSFARRTAAKRPLEREISTVAGMIYDSHNETPAYEAKALTLYCMLSAGSSASEFWDRYLYFLQMCTRRGGVTIVHGTEQGRYIYESMRVTDYMPSQPVPFIKFSVTLRRIKI